MYIRKIVLADDEGTQRRVLNAITCGVSEYLLKPFRVDDVRKILEKLEVQIRAQRNEGRHNSRYENLLERIEFLFPSGILVPLENRHDTIGQIRQLLQHFLAFLCRITDGGSVLCQITLSHSEKERHIAAARPPLPCRHCGLCCFRVSCV